MKACVQSALRELRHDEVGDAQQQEDQVHFLEQHAIRLLAHQRRRTAHEGEDLQQREDAEFTQIHANFTREMLFRGGGGGGLPALSNVHCVLLPNDSRFLTLLFILYANPTT